MEHFKDKVVIVTGGASGIGRALCEAISQRGAATIIAADINLEGARQTATQITTAGGNAHAVHLDVTDFNAVQALINGTVLLFQVDVAQFQKIRREP